DGHEPPYPVAAIAESLLLGGGGGKGATSDIELIPPNRSRSGGVSHHYGLISPQRLRATNVVIHDRRHDFIAKSLDEGGCSLLRHDGKPSGIRECVDERADCNQRVGSMIGANA